MLEHALLYLLTGALAGLFAGLFGIGGGIVVVPMLSQLFSLQFSSDIVMHMAVGTSLGIMVFTAISSAYAYYRRHLIVWPVFRNFMPGLILGIITGSTIGMHLASHHLRTAFAIFLVAMSIYMWVGKKVKAGRQLPSFLRLSSAALFIGLLSGFFGIGGGAMMVPFFVYCGIEMHKSTGTSAACGFLLALIGTLSLTITGLASHSTLDMPPGTLGYVYWPAALLIAPASVLFAPIGTRISVWLSEITLKRMFAIILLVTAIYLYAQSY